MVRLDLGLVPHLLSVGGVTLVLCFLSFPYLLQNDRQSEGNKIIFGKPDKYILTLGLLVFFAAVCEGGMYDWSGVYFREVVGVELFTLSYLAFMVSMTLSRFISDRFIEKLGESKYYIISASVALVGIAMIILFPYFIPALIGFSIAGFGVAAIFPMTFTMTSKSKKYAPGVAISLVATYATVGILIGPPLIGYIAHIFKLQYAFVLFFIAILTIIPLSRELFKILEADKN
jgi:fucose permease